MSNDWDSLFALAESLTGQAYTPQQRSGILRNNLLRRMRILNLNEDPMAYIRQLEQNDEELSHFVSACTIHTTSWFRELPHFERLKDYLRENQAMFKQRPFRMLCTACSTGQEPYSFACILETFRLTNPGFDYRIDAFDIDPLSVAEAQRAIYRWPAEVPLLGTKQPYIRIGRNNARGLFTFSKDLRSRLQFHTASLTDLPSELEGPYDWITCRNVLIYFKTTEVEAIVRNLKTKLTPQTGLLALGHSDNIDSRRLGFDVLQASLFRPVRPKLPKAQERQKMLIVDDAPTVRKRITQILKEHFDVSEAGNASEADKQIANTNYSVITLDLQMPGLNGLEWAKQVRRRGLKTPIVLISDSTPEDAPQILDVLGREVQDFFDKKSLYAQPQSLVERSLALSNPTKSETATVAKSRKSRSLEETPDLILIGASTGGTTALSELMRHFPKPSPPIVVVQHITPNFAKPFAERLAMDTGLTLGHAGQPLKPNHIYLALGDEHIGVSQKGPQLSLEVSHAPPQSRHRPSVDHLFHSAVRLKGKRLLAILMTGMGADGAQGMLALHQAGAYTVCQDQKSCIVFGMPKEAIALGAADMVGNINEIRTLMEQAIKRFKASAA